MNKREYSPPAVRQVIMTSIVAQIGPIQSQQWKNGQTQQEGPHFKLGTDDGSDDFMAREWDDDWDDWEEE